jgi:hypothetical protein
LTQALLGFEADMLVMNEEWEKDKITGALADLMKDLSVREFASSFEILASSLSQRLGVKSPSQDVSDAKEAEARTLDERKLDYVHLSNDLEPRSQTSVSFAACIVTPCTHLCSD